MWLTLACSTTRPIHPNIPFKNIQSSRSYLRTNDKVKVICVDMKVIYVTCLINVADGELLPGADMFHIYLQTLIRLQTSEYEPIRLACINAKCRSQFSRWNIDVRRTTLHVTINYVKLKYQRCYPTYLTRCSL